MIEDKKMTALDVSGDTYNVEQSAINSNNSLSDRATNCKVNVCGQTKTPSKTVIMTLAELHAMHLPRPIPIIENLLCPGVYVLAGAPKAGKSFLALQIAHCVSMGLPLWDFYVKKGSVLYMALEDSWFRVDGRATKMFETTIEESHQLYVCIQIDAAERACDVIVRFVSEHTDTCLVIIDTFQMVRRSSITGYSYSSDYADVGEFKAIADKLGIAILLIHHTRKMGSDRVFDLVSGTQGIAGAADGVMIMEDGDTHHSAVLSVTGRDIESDEYRLRHNRETLEWELEGNENDESEHPDIRALLNFLKKQDAEGNDLWSGTATDLHDEINAHSAVNALTKRIHQAKSYLADNGIAFDVAGGRNRRLTFWSLEDCDRDS